MRPTPCHMNLHASYPLYCRVPIFFLSLSCCAPSSCPHVSHSTIVFFIEICHLSYRPPPHAPYPLRCSLWRPIALSSLTLIYQPTSQPTSNRCLHGSTRVKQPAPTNPTDIATSGSLFCPIPRRAGREVVTPNRRRLRASPILLVAAHSYAPPCAAQCVTMCVLARLFLFYSSSATTYRKTPCTISTYVPTVM